MIELREISDRLKCPQSELIFKKLEKEDWQKFPLDRRVPEDFSAYFSKESKKMRLYRADGSMVCESERGSLPFDSDYQGD